MTYQPLLNLLRAAERYRSLTLHLVADQAGPDRHALQDAADLLDELLGLHAAELLGATAFTFDQPPATREGGDL